MATALPPDPQQAARRRAQARVSGVRTFLCAPEEGDRAEFRDLIEASFDHLAPWGPEIRREDDPTHDQRFDRLLRTPAGEKHHICRLDDGALVGAFNLNHIVRGVFQCAALGYWMGAPYLRRGYMADALEAGLRLAFEIESLHRVEANIRPENTGSVALVRRAGFRREGFSPRFLKIAGTWCDHERWALLADEWA